MTMNDKERRYGDPNKCRECNSERVLPVDPLTLKQKQELAAQAKKQDWLDLKKKMEQKTVQNTEQKKIQERPLPC